MKTLNIIAITLLSSILFYSCEKNEYHPEIADQEFTISENSVIGTSLGIIVAVDRDDGQKVTIEIVDGNEDGVFAVDPSSGLLSVADPSQLDFEKKKEFLLTVTAANDYDEDPQESSARIKIQVTDENEFAPVAEDQVINLTEIPQNGTQVAAIEADDEDIHQQLRYEILGTNRPGFLAVDSISGAVRIEDQQAIFQNGNVQIYAAILVKDNHVEWLSDTAMIHIYAIDLQDQLALYLPMNGDAVDQSTNNTPSIVNGPILAPDRYGNPDQAYLFDGQDDSINLNNNLALITSRQFTISLWAKFEGRSQSDLGSNVFFEQVDDINNTYESQTMVLFNGEYLDNINLSLKSSRESSLFETLANSSELVYDGEWHHFLVCFDELSKLRIYIDGRIKAQSFFLESGDFTADVDHVNLGAHHYDGENHGAFNGIMDEVLIFNRALKDFEIYALSSDVLND